MYLVAPPAARRSAKQSFRLRIADSVCVRGRDLVQVFEVTHSITTQIHRLEEELLSSYALPSIAEYHSGLSGDTENCPATRS